MEEDELLEAVNKPLKHVTFSEETVETPILKPRRCKSMNFIDKNVELASKAMYFLPITDDEKRHLEELLLNIDEHTESVENEEKNENAFSLIKKDKSRVTEIDLLLEDFEETSYLRKQDEKADNFWESLVLGEKLKKVEEKLAVLKEQDEIDSEILKP